MKIKYLNFYAYISTILIANLATVLFPPLAVWKVLIPPSAFFMGITFLLGNSIQQAHGGKAAQASLWAGLALTSLACFVFELPQSIVIASGLAFLVSQQLAQWLYRLFAKSIENQKANLYSSIIGSIVDVVLFIVVGLSPLGIGSVSWPNVIWAVIGQLTVQVSIQWLLSKKLSNN